MLNAEVESPNGQVMRPPEHRTVRLAELFERGQLRHTPLGLGYPTGCCARN
jgi:hypothetical protein